MRLHWLPSVVAVFFIAAPVKTVFIFCDFAHCSLLLYLLAK